MTWGEDRGEVFARLDSLAVSQKDNKNILCSLKTSFENFRLKTTKDVTELQTKSKMSAAFTALIVSVLTSGVMGTILMVYLKGAAS